MRKQIIPLARRKKNDVQDFPKIDVQDYPVDKDIQALAGTIVIPPLNNGIPENVSLKDIRKAVDRYEQADKRWKESFKRRDLGVKEDAYNLLFSFTIYPKQTEQYGILMNSRKVIR